MGLKTSTRLGGSLFFIFLIINQAFFFAIASAENNSQNVSSIHRQPLNPIGPYEPNDVYYSNEYLLVVDDLVIAGEFLNISKPSEPNKIEINFGFHQVCAFTNYGNIILFGLSESPFNYSIMKIDLTTSSTNYTKIDANWNVGLQRMSLTNYSLYSLSRMRYGQYEFLIHNATNINNLTLLGNTTLVGFGYNTDFVVHDDIVCFLSNDNNLSVFQINSTYQLSFVRNYFFAELESIYFHENYLYVCDKFGFQIFNYTDPSNLTSVAYYNISSAQTIRIFNDVAYLTTTYSFTTLSLSNIMDIHILDQYRPGKREDIEMWKLELSGNLAVILTEQMKYFDYSDRYGGYLYIFDISSPSHITRLFPDKIPKIDAWTLFILKITMVIVVLPVVTVLSVILIFVRKYWKKKQQKKKDSSFET